MTFIFGLWGSAILARAFNKTISGIIKNFFQLKAVKTSGGNETANWKNMIKKNYPEYGNLL